MDLLGRYLDSQKSMKDQKSETHLEVKVNDRNILETQTDRQTGSYHKGQRGSRSCFLIIWLIVIFNVLCCLQYASFYGFNILPEVFGESL